MFGSGPTFGNRLESNNSIFGTKSVTVSSTSTPIATGFSAFANKSSAFNQLAGNAQQKTSPQQNSTLFGGNVQNSSFSLFVLYFFYLY